MRLQCCRLLFLALGASSPLISAFLGVPSPSSNMTSGHLQPSRLPWVVLPKNSTAFTGHVTDEDCVGLLVSPTAALMTASCIEINLASVNSVAVSLTEGSTVEVGDLAEPGLPHWRIRDPVSIIVHPLSKDSLRAYSFAVVRWQDPISTPTAPVVLDTRGDKRLSSQEDDPVETLAVFLGVTETDSVIRRSRTACVGDFDSKPIGGLVCVEAKWESEQLCSELAKQNGFIARSALGRVIVSGLVPETVNCGVTDDTTAPTIGHAGVSLLINAREFIDKTLTGHEWLETLVGSSASSASPSFGDDDWYGPTEEPVVGLDPVGTKKPEVLWRRDLSDNKAFLSREAELLVDPRNSLDGGFAVMIAPQFLLTRASWIRGFESIEYAHFSDQTIRIRRLIVDQLPRVQPSEQLVVVELEREPEGRFIVPLTTVSPPENVDLMTLQTVVMDVNSFDEANETAPGIEAGFEINAVVDSSVCQQSSPDSDAAEGLMCVQSSDHWATNPRAMPYLPYRSSFLTVGDSLLALAWSPSVTNVVGQVAQSYQALGTSLRVRKYLDEATNGSVVWSEEDLSLQQPESLGIGRILLYGNDSSTTDPPVAVPCGAIMISVQFYLTTASCLGDVQVTWAVHEPAQFISSNGLVKTLKLTEELVETTEPVEATSTSASQAEDDDGGRDGDSLPTDEQLPPENLPKGAVPIVSVVVHPLYSSSRPGVFDFAIIQLVKSEEIDQSSVRLWGEPLPSQSRVVEHDLVSDRVSDRAGLVVNESECNLELGDGVICVGPTQLSPSAQCSGGSGTHGLFHRVGETVLFVGFSLSTGNGCKARRPYSQVSTILNFINAVVDKPKWGMPSQVSAYNSKLPEHPGLIANKVIRKPYVVGLRMTKDGQNFCGGSLISSQFVLTAAHCVTDGLANWVSIGSVESAGLNTEPIPVNAKRTRIHPQYKSPYRYSHDAAILELSVPAYEEKIPLATTRDFQDGRAATMYGYGVDSADSNVLSSTMHARDLSLLSKATCERTLPNIDGAVLCALAANGLDACTGDSGSPLVITDTASGRDQLVGVVSAGYGCGVAGVPGLYTRVASIASFINAYSVDPAWVGGTDSIGNAEPPAKAPSTSPSPSGVSPSTTASATPSTSTGSGSGSSSQAKDLPELPLEERNSQMTGPPSSAPAPSSSSSPSMAPLTPSTSVFEAAIVRTTLPNNTLSVVTETALMQFLVGDYAYILVPSTLLQAIASPHNALTFFSTGDVRGLLNVLAKHNATPLNRRKDRFQTAELSTNPRLQATQATSC